MISKLKLSSYSFIRDIAIAGRRALPYSLVQSRSDLSKKFSIGITTYVERYEQYFKPLYTDLCRIFPEVKIVVAVNGITDQYKQAAYLKRLEEEVCCFCPKQNIFIFHDQPVGLTVLWNEIVSQIFPKSALVLNDDLSVFPWFRKWTENSLWNQNNLILLNNSWSHFILPYEVYKSVGPFDPGYKGIGFEDMDYTARLGMLKRPIINILCPYLIHFDDKPLLTSYDQISSRVWGKYTSYNQKYFYEKWEITTDKQGIYIRQIDANVINKRPLTIKEYDKRMEATWMIRKNILYPDRIITKSA